MFVSAWGCCSGGREKMTHTPRPSCRLPTTADSCKADRLLSHRAGSSVVRIYHRACTHTVHTYHVYAAAHDTKVRFARLLGCSKKGPRNRPRGNTRQKTPTQRYAGVKTHTNLSMKGPPFLRQLCWTCAVLYPMYVYVHIVYLDTDKRGLAAPCIHSPRGSSRQPDEHTCCGTPHLVLTE